MKKLYQALSLLLISLIFVPQITFALTADQRRDIELRPFYDKTDTVACSSNSNGGGSFVLIGSNNAEKIFNFLVGKGLTVIQAAGVMGNIQAESSFDPTLEERTGRAQKGYGLVQWTFGRRTALEAAAQAQGVPVSDLSFQLGFMWNELTTSYKGSVYNPLKASASLEEATYVWLEHYEIPANIPANKPIRLGFAQNILKQPWASGTIASTGTDSNSTQTIAAGPCGDSLAPVGTSTSKIVTIAQQELALGANEADGSYHKYTDGANESWCADFLSWVMKQAGTPFTGGVSGGWRIPAVTNVRAWYQQAGKFKPARQGYVPKPGDVVIYEEGKLPYKSHVNIVISVAGKSFTSIGGNQGNKVGSSTQASYDADYITGFGVN